MKKNRLLLTIALLTASASALADDMKTNRQAAEALQEIGTTQYEVDSATAPIRTKADLRQHLATSPRSPFTGSAIQPAMLS